MRKILTAAVLASGLAVAGATIGATGAQAATPQSQLKCFTGGPEEGESGFCETIGTNGAHLTANGTEQTYAGVYLDAKRTNGRALSQVTFSFDWTGSISGGAPRFSLPIDTDGDGANDGYAFIDAVNCGGVSGGSGTVSTTSDACPVYFGPDVYANWAAFAAANPTWTTAKDAQPFAIADWDADVTLSNVTFANN